MRTLITFILLTYAAFGQMAPDGISHWTDQTDKLKQAARLGGAPSNYPSGSGWFPIENDWLMVDDTLPTNRRGLLKADVNHQGQSTITVDFDGNTYTISQRLLKMVWINTDTKNWTDIADVTWDTPSIDSNIVKWTGIIPGVDYRLRKSNGSVEHGIFFKPSFLDSAITLYDQRADSQYIALGNAMAYTLTGVDNADSGIGTVDRRVLKQIGKMSFGLNKQELRFPGSDSLPPIPVKQRWIKQGGKIYCVEYVMMSDVKRVHESYPTATIWHNSSITLNTSADVDDFDINFYSQNTNTGTVTTMYTSDGADGRRLFTRFDLAGNGIYGTIDTAIFELNTYDGTGGDYWYHNPVIPAWVEATACWAHIDSTATPTYTYWGGGGDWDDTIDPDSCGTAAFCDTSDVTTSGGNQRMIFDGTGTKVAVQAMADGTYQGGFISSWSGSGTGLYRSVEHATTSYRPSLYVEWRIPPYLVDTLESSTEFRDGYLDEDNPTWNYGGSQSFHVGEIVGGAGLFNTYLFWDIPDISAKDSVLVGGFLWVNNVDESANSDTLEIYATNGTYGNLVPGAVGNKNGGVAIGHEIDWEHIWQPLSTRNWDNAGGDWDTRRLGFININTAEVVGWHRSVIDPGWLDGVAQGDTNNYGVFLVPQTTSPGSGDWDKSFSAVDNSTEKIRPFFELFYHTSTENIYWPESYLNIDTATNGDYSFEASGTTRSDSLIAIQRGADTTFMVNARDTDFPNDGGTASFTVELPDVTTLVNIDSVYMIARSKGGGSSTDTIVYRLGLINGTDTSWSDTIWIDGVNLAEFIEDTLVSTTIGGGDWTPTKLDNAKMIFKLWNNDWTFIESMQVSMIWAQSFGDTISGGGGDPAISSRRRRIILGGN